MVARLGRRPFAWGLLVCALGVVTGGAAAEPSAEELKTLAGLLDAPDFLSRERAAERLIAAGGRAVEPLGVLLKGPSAEAKWRATAALIEIATSGDDEVFAQATAVLGLDASDLQEQAGFALRLEDLRAKQAARRRARAEVSIRSLGGLIGIDAGPALSLLDPPAAASAPPVTAALDQALNDLSVLQPRASIAPPAPIAPQGPPAPEPPPEISAEELAALLHGELQASEPAADVAIADAFVSPELHEPAHAMESERSLTLTETWRGGDEGLADLRHLPDIVSVRLERAPISDAALQYISVLPRLRDMRIIRSPFSPGALGRFRQRHPNVTVLVNDQVR